jgi:hypothetical protein
MNEAIQRLNGQVATDLEREAVTGEAYRVAQERLTELRARLEDTRDATSEKGHAAAGDRWLLSENEGRPVDGLGIATRVVEESVEGLDPLGQSLLLAFCLDAGRHSEK